MRNTTAASAKGICRTEYNRITNRIGKPDTILYVVYNLGCCTRLTDLFHGIFECLTVLCLKNCLSRCSDQLYTIFIKNSLLCKFHTKV